MTECCQLERLREAKGKVAGAKQVVRALKEGALQLVYIARDADPFVTRKVVVAAEAARVRLVEVDTMDELGKASGINIDTAAAGILK